MREKRFENTLAQQRAYRENNKEKIRAQQKQWRLNNPKKVIANAKASTARRNGTVPFTPNPLPDKLLLTLHVKLTVDQENYLFQNKEMARPQLFRSFRKQFNSNINKLRFNFALEKICKTTDQVEYRQNLA